ncbi:hypothetical protein ABZ547_30515 [Streptomyces sparsogenes]|uniref:hypothetical protein n=1 Tax=Streptomyces sparsogenes TaxID=67365 RepID=UPI0033C1EE1F
MHAKARMLSVAMGVVALPAFVAPTAAGQSGSPEGRSTPNQEIRLQTGGSCASGLPDAPGGGAEKVSALIDRLTAQGLAQDEIDAKLAQDACLQRVDDGGGDVTTLGNPDDEISIGKPLIYRPAGKSYYIAAASWKWKKIPKDIDGYDGFGISFNKKVTHLAHSLTYKGKYYGKKKMKQAEDSGPYGAAFIFNEGPRGYAGLDIQGRRGTMVIAFKPTSGCQKVQAFSKYAHTWKSTSVTSASIGKWSIGFAWTNYDHKWQQASQPSGEAKVCR